MSDESNGRIATLEAQVRDLTEALHELRAATKTVSMRDARRCPQCDGTELIVVPASQFAPVTEEQVSPLGLVHYLKWGIPTVKGTLEHVVCRQCGRVETHASDLDEVRIDGKYVRLLASEPDGAPPRGGPYR